MEQKPTQKKVEPEDDRPLAKDGTRRGRKPGTKNRATQLLDQIQEHVEQKYGIKNFDPVVALVDIGVQASIPQPIVDHKGRPRHLTEMDDEGKETLKLDDEGDPIPLMTIPDESIAKDCFAKAAPYVRSTLKQIEITDGEDGPIDADVAGAKDRFLQMVKAGQVDEDVNDEEEEETND